MTSLMVETVNIYRNQSGEEILQLRLADDSVMDAYALTDKLKKGARFDVEIKRHYEKRSLNANAYAWVLMDKLAAVHGIPKTEIYRTLLRDVGGASYIYPVEMNRVLEYKADWECRGLGWMVFNMGPSKHKGYMNLMCIKGSSQFDKEQMAKLIDLIIQECQQVDIPTDPPQKIQEMIEEWANEKQESKGLRHIAEGKGKSVGT